MVVGPSGAGKDTLIAGAVRLRPALHWARRVITRPEVAGGEPFEGVTEAEFEQRRAAGEFALTWRAHGLCYGVPFAELVAPDVVINGSRGAMAAILAALPHAVVLRISAPDAVLAERLAARGRESRADILARLVRAKDDLDPSIAVVDVVNDQTPEIGVARFLAALSAARGSADESGLGHLGPSGTDR